MESDINIRPLGARILVKLVEAETKTKEGIILPNAIKANQNKAYVLALGDGIRYQDGKWLEFPYKLGDCVLLTRYAGNELGDDLLLVNAEDVLGVFDA